MAAERLNVPGGLIFGAMVGAAAVTLWRDLELRLPGLVEDAAMVVIGAGSAS